MTFLLKGSLKLLCEAKMGTKSVARGLLQSSQERWRIERGDRDGGQR